MTDIERDEAGLTAEERAEGERLILDILHAALEYGKTEWRWGHAARSADMSGNRADVLFAQRSRDAMWAETVRTVAQVRAALARERRRVAALRASVDQALTDLENAVAIVEEVDRKRGGQGVLVGIGLLGLRAARDTLVEALADAPGPDGEGEGR